MSLLTAIICVPLFAAFFTAIIPRNYRVIIRGLALAASGLTLLLALRLFVTYDAAPVVDGFRFVQEYPWMTSLGISYHVGVDGINLGLVVMGAIVAFAATCASWEIKTQEKEYYILLHVMIAGILGAFSSLDAFLFYFFHELALVPTFIMIGVWGRGENKNYAAFNITIYLSLGALISLIGLIMLYVQSGANTFDIVELTQHIKRKPIPAAAQNVIFPLLMFGFGILVSLWPFHTWAPLGYGAAPTATSMLHAGVLKKFGLYGLIRIALPMLPEGARSWLHILAFLCLGNILYCGLVAIRQRNLNQLIGNSSVAHMGFIFLGIASLNLIGVTGAVVIMVAHGLLAALTFGLSGYLYQHTGTLNMDQMGGLLRRLPFIGTALIMAMLAGCGLPGFANFVGEAMVLFGAFKDFTVVTALATWGALVIGAVYMLRAIRDILHGPLAAAHAAVPDANAWRKLPFAMLVVCLLVLGIWPRLLVDKIQPSVKPIVALANGVVEKPAPKKPVSAPKGSAGAPKRAKAAK
jgi:NADH-quinone oxidoreductase subunit M